MRNSVDKVLLEKANRQFGVLKLADLEEAGLTRSQISRRVKAGRLTRLHPQVYCLGHTALTDKGRWLAALWACGEGAVLSHATAVAFHGYGSAEGDIHVTARGAARDYDGVVVHRVRQLDSRDVFHDHPFAVTTIPRMLVDCADLMPYSGLREVADQLPYLRLDRIKHAQDRAPNRKGAPSITRLLDADSGHTKSEFERRYLRTCTTYGLAKPDDTNQRIAGHKADCVYRHARLVIELDGRAYHRRRREMRRDRRRDSDYQLAGYRILRLVWDDLHRDEAGQTADRIRRFLAS
jgi:very-short-patch-repair endonuclease